MLITRPRLAVILAGGTSMLGSVLRSGAGGAAMSRREASHIGWTMVYADEIAEQAEALRPHDNAGDR